MRLNRVNVLTISFLVELTVSIISSEPVSMKVRLESTSGNYRYINFYNDTFKRLYECMTDTDYGQCNVKAVYESSGKQATNYTATNVTSLRTAHLNRSYFTCLYNQNVETLQCERYNTSQCSKDTCDSFSLQGSSICDNQCVHLMWTYADEKLTLSTTARFEYCDPVCTTTAVYFPTVHSTEPSSHPSVTSRLPSDHTSEVTTNSSSAADIANTSSRQRSPAKQIPIIIGVVCSLIVIIIVVIVIGIMYRRRKLIKGFAGNNGISSPHTDAKCNGGHGQRSLSSTRNVSNKPDVLSTLPHSGRGGERNEESEDGYYTIDKDNELNRYENGLNIVSSGTSHIHGGYELKHYQNALGSPSATFRIQEQDDNSQLPHTREGDYFVISENDNDEDSRSVNEERNVDGGYSLAKDVSMVDVIDVSSQPKDVGMVDVIDASSQPKDVSTVDVIDVSSQPKDVSMVDVIDVSSQPKNVYSRFGNETTVRNNPYDMLLQPHEILDSRKASIGVTPMKGTVDDDDAAVANTTIEIVETDCSSQAPKTLSDMARDTTIVFPGYSTVNKTKT